MAPQQQVARIPRLALGVAEAAEALGMSEGFFHEYVAPELAWTRRGRKKVVALKELETWLERTAQRVLP
jgi:hypothetical protein